MPHGKQDSTASADKWMAKALALARKAAAMDEVPVGAVVVHQGRVVGRGYNLRERDQNPLAHAEVQAIRAAARKLKSWRLTDCLLVVTLEPCPMCLAACQQARLSHVVYGAADPKGGALSLGYALNEDRRLNHRFTVEHVPHAECGHVLRDFFKAKRNRASARG
jgi:tRNA(adenine34) deaminase